MSSVHYSFIHSQDNPIDIPRICQEAEQDGKVAVVVDGGDRQNSFEWAPRLVLIHEKFLGKFIGGDAVYVAGGLLSDEWGERYVADGVAERKICFMVFRSDCGDARPLPDGWRAMTSESDVADIICQLRAAKRYVRRVPVTVTQVF